MIKELDEMLIRDTLLKIISKRKHWKTMRIGIVVMKIQQTIRIVNPITLKSTLLENMNNFRVC